MKEQTITIPYLTREEKDLLCFSRPAGYHTRLQQYWSYPEAFAAATTPQKTTVCLSTTTAFRHYLRRFIRTFHPEALLPGKNLWLHLEKDGRFSVRLGIHGPEVTSLSESDNYVFQYLCYLQTRRFWHYMRKRCRFPAEAFPAFISNFSGYLEESASYHSLLRRAASVASRVIEL